MKCAPWACTKYGKRLKQPMPPTVEIFSCHILRFSISLKYSASTEKSPQPGHHVGWSAAISFLVRPLRSPGKAGAVTEVMFPARSGVSVVAVIVLKSQFAQSGGDVGFGAFENFLHLPGEAVGLVDALDFRVAITGAQQRPKLAETVKSLVIHLHDENVVEAGENIFQPGRQRIDVPDVDRGDAVAGGAGAVHGFLDGAFRGTPADEQNIAFGRAVNLRHGQRGAERLHFLA